MPPFPMEVGVIDGCSVDGTSALCKEAAIGPQSPFTKERCQEKLNIPLITLAGAAT